MSSDELLTKPASVNLGEESVSARLVLDPSSNVWNVNVVISRKPDQPPVEGSEVDAQLVDAKGDAMDLLEQPRGALTEAGTSLSASVNAVFKFRDSKSPPAKLILNYRGRKAEFEVGSS